MHRVAVLAIVLLGVVSASTAHAAPKRVWLFGDGISGRMYSELDRIVDKTKLDVKNLAAEESGPGDLLPRIQLSLLATAQASWPQVVIIGYSASAGSYAACGFAAWVWGPAVQSWATAEATYELQAAAYLRSLNIKVIMTRGPNVPAGKGKDCLQSAFNHVWSQTSPSGIQHVDWRLDRNNSNYWANDWVHVSCNPGLYKPIDFRTGLPYPNPCAGSAYGQLWNGTYVVMFNGALTIAERVKAALMALP